MAKAKNTELTSAFDLFNKSTEVVKRNLNNFAILMILPFLATLFSIFNTNNSSRGFSGSSTFAGLPTYAVFSLSAIGIILGIVIFVAALMIEAMTNVLKVEGAKGKTPNLKHLFEVGKKYWLRLFGFYIIYAVMLIVGFILLIVPGLIVLRRYSLVPYIIIDKNATFKEAESLNHTVAIFGQFTAFHF